MGLNVLDHKHTWSWVDFKTDNYRQQWQASNKDKREWEEDREDLCQSSSWAQEVRSGHDDMSKFILSNKTELIWSDFYLHRSKENLVRNKKRAYTCTYMYPRMLLGACIIKEREEKQFGKSIARNWSNPYFHLLCQNPKKKNSAPKVLFYHYFLSLHTEMTILSSVKKTRSISKEYSSYHFPYKVNVYMVKKNAYKWYKSTINVAYYSYFHVFWSHRALCKINTLYFSTLNTFATIPEGELYNFTKIYTTIIYIYTIIQWKCIQTHWSPLSAVLLAGLAFGKLKIPTYVVQIRFAIAPFLFLIIKKWRKVFSQQKGSTTVSKSPTGLLKMFITSICRPEKLGCGEGVLFTHNDKPAQIVTTNTHSSFADQTIENIMFLLLVNKPLSTI